MECVTYYVFQIVTYNVLHQHALALLIRPLVSPAIFQTSWDYQTDRVRLLLRRCVLWIFVMFSKHCLLNASKCWSELSTRAALGCKSVWNAFSECNLDENLLVLTRSCVWQTDFGCSNRILWEERRILNSVSKSQRESRRASHSLFDEAKSTTIFTQWLQLSSCDQSVCFGEEREGKK